jgi:hypothetical protein
LDFLSRFSLKSPISYFMEIRPVVAALIHADRGTDGYDEGNRHCHATTQKVPDMVINGCGLEF